MPTPSSSNTTRPATSIEDKPRMTAPANATTAATPVISKADAAKAAEDRKGKLAAIERAMGAIEKAYGKGSIM